MYAGHENRSGATGPGVRLTQDAGIKNTSSSLQSSPFPPARRRTRWCSADQPDRCWVSWSSPIWRRSRPA